MDPKFIEDLLKGKIIHINLAQLHFILYYQNEYNINTISVQQDVEGNYWCKADKSTVKNYIERSQI